MIRRYLNTVEESKMISGAGVMNLVCPREDGRLEWGNGVVSMLFDTAGDSPVRLCNVAYGQLNHGFLILLQMI